jgi:F-type H+-transporting ATPase subunit b
VIHEAKEQASEIVSQAQKRGNEIVDESKANARVEGERILNSAKAEIDQEANRARDELKFQVGGIALAGAGKIFGREIDEKAYTDLFDELVSRI